MKPMTLIAGLASLLAVAALTNPSPERHREKLREAVAERSPLAGALGVGAVAAFVSDYHSWGLASYTKVGERTVTVGAFGVVVVKDLSGSEKGN